MDQTGPSPSGRLVEPPTAEYAGQSHSLIPARHSFSDEHEGLRSTSVFSIVFLAFVEVGTFALLVCSLCFSVRVPLRWDERPTSLAVFVLVSRVAAAAHFRKADLPSSRKSFHG